MAHFTFYLDTVGWATGMVVCLWRHSDCSFAHLITPVIILSSNKIQKGKILAPANPSPPGKMAVKLARERVHLPVYCVMYIPLHCVKQTCTVSLSWLFVLQYHNISTITCRATLECQSRVKLKFMCPICIPISLQCFDTVGWVTGRASSL